MDAREITRQDLGTSAQVTGDAQMLFLQRYVSLRASHLNCFSAVSWKPPLKCFQEPGIELLPTTPSGPCNMPHLQLLTVEKSHLYSEIWCFHNCSFRQPTREMFGSSCSSKTTFFFFQLLFLAGKERSIQFLPTREKMWNLVPTGSSHIACCGESLPSVTASTMQLSSISNGFFLLSLGFKKKKNCFVLVFMLLRDIFSPLWKLEVCALHVWVDTKAYSGHSQI